MNITKPPYLVLRDMMREVNMTLGDLAMLTAPVIQLTERAAVHYWLDVLNNRQELGDKDQMCLDSFLPLRFMKWSEYVGRYADKVRAAADRLVAGESKP